MSSSPSMGSFRPSTESSSPMLSSRSRQSSSPSPPIADSYLAIAKAGHSSLVTHPYLEVLDSSTVAVASIIAYISASRWDLMLAKLRNCVKHYTSAPEEALDLSEMRLIEHCSWPEERLAILLAECGVLSQIKKAALPAFCLAIRKAIRHYYASDPYTLTRLYSGQYKPVFVGQPENLFLLAYNLSDGGKRKALAWPLMATVVSLCVDGVTKMVNGEDTRPPSLNKKAQFLRDLRKLVREGGKAADVNLALACYVDMCHAATYTDGPHSVLRGFTKDMHKDLLTRLLDPGRPFVQADSSLDVALTTDAFLVMYKLSPSLVSRDVLPRLLNRALSDSTIAASLCACSSILEESDSLPWHPNGLDIGLTIIAPVRRILHSLITSAFGVDEGGQPSVRPLPQARASMADLGSERNILLMAILRLVAAEPNLLHLKPETKDSVLSTRNLQAPSSAGELLVFNPHSASQSFLLLACLVDEYYHAKVRQAAIDLFLRLQQCAVEEIDLHHPQYVDASLVFNETVETIGLALVRQNLQLHVDSSLEHTALQNLVEWLGMTQQVLRQLQNYPKLSSLVEGCETVGLLALASQTESHRLLAFDLMEIVAIIASIADCPSNAAAVAKAIREESSVIVGGRLAQMRRLVKVYSGVAMPLASLQMAWSEASDRWKLLSQKLQDGKAARGDNPEASLLLEHDIVQWTSLSAFLTASLYSATSLDAASQIPLEALPLQYSLKRIQHDRGPSFVTALAGFLYSEHPRLSDAARELLSQDLDCHYLSTFIDCAFSVTESLFDADVGENLPEELVLHFDQTLSVLLGMLARKQTSPSLERERQYRLEGIVLSALFHFKDLDPSATCARLKTKVCRMIELLKSYSSEDKGTANAAFRCSVLAHLLTYVEKESVNKPSGKTSVSDLQGAALRALAVITHDLVVFRPTLREDTSPGSTRSADPRLARSCVSLLLSACRDLLTSPPEPRSNVGETRPILSTRTPSSTGQGASPSTNHGEAVKTAIVNLVVANLPALDISAFDLRFTDHPGLQLAKLEMAAVCLKRWYFDTKDQTTAPQASEALQTLVRIVCAPDMKLVLAMLELAPSSEHDVLLDLVYELFERHNILDSLLQAVIAKEVREIAHESTLFRGNSAASRLLTIFARREGYFYLRALVGDLLDRLSEESFGSLDLDVHQMSSPDDAHFAKLQLVAEAFLSRICTTWSELPASMRNLCYHIKSMVKDRFPDSEYTSIGGWIFLRFINPAIISPDIADLELPEESREGRRALVLISKLMQALSNNIRFKEPGMQTLNSFVSDHILEMTSFLTQISSSPAPDRSSEVRSSTSSNICNTMDSMMLYTFLWSNMEQIGSKLLTSEAAMTSSSEQVPNAQRQWSRLTEILWQIKQTAEHTMPLASHLAAPTRSGDLYRPELHRLDMPSIWAESLRTDLRSRLGHPAISLALRKLHKHRSDYEGLLRYILMVTSSPPEPFDILLDCSGFAPVNEAPYEILISLGALLHHQPYLDRLHAVYLYAPNTAFVTYFRQVAGTLPVDIIERKLHVLADLQELEDAFPSVMAVLDADSLALASEESIFSTTAVFTSAYREPALVTLSLNLTNLSVRCIKRKVMTSELRAAPVDNIRLEDITGIAPAFDKSLNAVEISQKSGKVFVLVDLADRKGFLQTFVTLKATLKTHNLRDYRSAGLDTLFAAGLASMTQDITTNAGSGLVHCIIGKYLSQDNQTPAFGVSTALESQQLLDQCEQVAEKRLDIVPEITLAILGTFSDLSASRWIKMLPILRVFVSRLATGLQFRAILASKAYEVISSLSNLSLAGDISYALLQQKIWPILLKHEASTLVVVRHLQVQLQRLDLSSREQQAILNILRAIPSVYGLRGRLLQGAYLTLQNQEERSPSPQAWLEISCCLRIDAALAEVEPSSTLALVPEVAFLVAMYSGVGTQEQHSAVAGLHQQLVATLQASLAAHEIHVNGSTAQYDTTEETHKIVSIGPLDDYMRALLKTIAGAEVTEDTRNMWTARLTSLILPIILQAGHPFQLQAVILLSHITPSDRRIVAAVLRAFLAELEGSTNITVLQAFLTYFGRALRLSGDQQLAGQLFWVALFLVNAHSTFLTPCVQLLQSCITCISTHALSDQDNLQDVLLRARRRNEAVYAAAKQLDIALQVEFTQDTFAFALSSVLAGHTKHPQLHDSISTILKHLTIMGSETSGSSAESQPVLSILGYLVTLLPTASKRQEGLRVTDLLHAAGLEVKQSDMHEPYLPLLANVEISTNEPLVLASALATSLLLAADSDEERVLLLSFLQEVADLSPSVLMLLQNRLLSNLSIWIKTSNARLMDVASSLLTTLLSTPSDPNLPDITSYLGALGFLDLLDCTSRRPNDDAQTISYRLSCCAGLVRAYHDL